MATANEIVCRAANGTRVRLEYEAYVRDADKGIVRVKTYTITGRVIWLELPQECVEEWVFGEVEGHAYR